MRIIIWYVALLFSPMVVFANEEVVLDVTEYQIPFENVTKAALYALIKRDWVVETVASDYVTGTQNGGDIKVKIVFQKDKRIIFRFVGESGGPQKWLNYLREDTLIGLTSCMP